MHALYSLGDVRIRVQHRGHVDIKLGIAETVQAVAFLPFEIPVLHCGTVCQ